MKISGISTLLAVLIFSYAACYGAAKARDTSIAVMEPGIGIGDIKIGDPLGIVIKKMGKPSDGKTIRTEKGDEYWITYTEMGITFIFGEGRKLEKIAVSNPGLVIRHKGIRVTNDVPDLDRLYGPGETRRLNEKYLQRTYKDKGVSFTINSDTEKIETITIESARK